MSLSKVVTTYCLIIRTSRLRHGRILIIFIRRQSINDNQWSKIMRKTWEWMIYPALAALFIFAFMQSQNMGFNPGISLLIITVVHMAIIALLELAMPARHDWNWLKDRQVINDLIHGVLLDFGARIGSAALTITLLAIAASQTGQAIWQIWPTQSPLLFQIVLAVLLYDFVDYWKHRAYHAWAWAWPIHVVHHNPSKMNVFKAGRLHFLEATIRAAITSAPMIVLGAPAEVFWWVAALANLMGGQNHWNVKSRLPRFLDVLIATPNTHWLHHAIGGKYRVCNLSPYTMWPDHLFGTFQQQPRDSIEDVGVDFDPVPKNILGQIAAPFIWPWLVSRTTKILASQQCSFTGIEYAPSTFYRITGRKCQRDSWKDHSRYNGP